MTTFLVAAFLGTLAVLMVAVAITVRSDRLRVVPEPEPIPARLVCDLEECHEPSAVEFDCGLDGNMFICRLHAGRVSKWAPVVGIREGLS